MWDARPEALLSSFPQILQINGGWILILTLVLCLIFEDIFLIISHQNVLSFYQDWLLEHHEYLRYHDGFPQ